jgi:hypothetical protein
MEQHPAFHYLSGLLARPLVTFDLETTGNVAEEDRIVQFCFKKLHRDGKLETINMFVDPIYPISEGALRLHGITDDMVSVCCFCSINNYYYALICITAPLCAVILYEVRRGCCVPSGM